jgi:glycerophosphoryl diester phosphodiesterase
LLRSIRRPLVLAHRGYRAMYPENTLLAFAKALEAGADGVECDVQKSADGRYLVIHDPSVDRVSDGQGEVASMSLEQLRRLDFGRGERIPELVDLLAALPPNAYLDVELKGETLVPADCAQIEAILASGIDRRRLMISSFEAPLLTHFRKCGYTVGFLVGDRIAAQGFTALARLLLGLRPQYVNLPVQIVDRLGAGRARLFLRLLGLLGFSILLWTVNDTEDPAGILRFARILVTDEVERVLAAAKGRAVRATQKEG